MIKIKVSNLSNGRYDYGFEGKVNDLEIFEPYVGNFKTNVVLSKFDNQIILDSETEIEANLICDRCAKDFHSVIKSNFRTVYLFRVNHDDADNEKEAIVFIHQDADKINLDEDIRDYAVLAIPMKNLCSEDCKGLCPKCGQNLNEGSCNCSEENIDPRWEPIQKLKSKNN
jgi:uncharacterized protein